MTWPASTSYATCWRSGVGGQPRKAQREPVPLLSRGLLLGYGLAIEPVGAADAERAAALWRSGSGLSIADRLCLATAERLDATVWTADATWGSSARIIQIR